MPGAEHGCCRAAHIHGVGAGGQGVDNLFDHGVQGAAGAFPGSEFSQLGVVGQFAVPQQVRDFFEAAFGGQFLDRIPAVKQRVGVRVDLRDGGVVHHDSGKAFFDVFSSHAELLRS